MTLVDLEAANPSPPELEALWLEEAARRDRAIDAGELGETPGAEVFQELKAQFR
jgi:hypothetical protein